MRMTPARIAFAVFLAAVVATGGCDMETDRRNSEEAPAGTRVSGPGPPRAWLPVALQPQQRTDGAVRVARDLIEYGEVQRAWIGIEVNELEADNFGRSRGVQVSRVTSGSPAASVGIRVGARLLMAGGRRLATPLDYEAVMLDLRAGDRIRVNVEGTDEVLLAAAPLPSVTATRVELLEDLEVITVTSAVRSELRLSSRAGALVVEISTELSRVTGLTQGDVILAVNNRQVATAQEAAAVLQATQREARQFILVFERENRTIRTGLLEWR